MLVCEITAVPRDGAANAYLIKYLSGRLRVARSLISIVRGHTARHKLIEINAPEADLEPLLAAIPQLPQANLFDSLN